MKTKTSNETYSRLLFTFSAFISLMIFVCFSNASFVCSAILFLRFMGVVDLPSSLFLQPTADRMPTPIRSPITTSKVQNAMKRISRFPCKSMVRPISAILLSIVSECLSSSSPFQNNLGYITPARCNRTVHLDTLYVRQGVVSSSTAIHHPLAFSCENKPHEKGRKRLNVYKDLFRSR